MNLRTKRLTDAKARLDLTLTRREDHLRKLIKTEVQISALRKQIARLERPAPDRKPTPPVPDDDGSIPTFLQRTPAQAKAIDDAAAAQITAEQEERRKTKARNRIDKLKAKQRGDLKKMPLEGRAALDHIRNG